MRTERSRAVNLAVLLVVLAALASLLEGPAVWLGALIVGAAARPPALPLPPPLDPPPPPLPPRRGARPLGPGAVPAGAPPPSAPSPSPPGGAPRGVPIGSLAPPAVAA